MTAIHGTIFVARHGETDWNVEQRVQGRSDRPLTPRGRRQAAELASQLQAEQLDAIFSSDLRRAYDTALAVAKGRQIEVHPLASLRERDYGTWEGMLYSEVLERFPEAAYTPGGDAETIEELSERVIEALRKIMIEYTSRRVLVVSSGGPVRAIMSYAAGEENKDAVGHCEVVRFTVHEGILRLSE